MENRRATRIPKPPAIVRPKLPTAKHLQTTQEMNITRKRKPTSPLRPANDSKRPATSAATKQTSAATRTKADTASVDSAAKATAAAGASGSQAVEDSWEHISEAKGWTPQDCLDHRVAVKKREKDQVIKEALQHHIKTLRALGRHLLTLTEKADLDLEAHKQSLFREQEQRSQEQQQHDAALAGLRTELSGCQEAISRLETEVADKSASIAQLDTQRTALQVALTASEAQTDALRSDQARASQQIMDLQQQVTTQTELHHQAQKYNAQLQEYNGKLQDDLRLSAAQLQQLQAEKASWSEEGSSMRGSIRALEAQVAAGRAAVESAETAQRGAVSDADRVRSELSTVTAARDTAAQAVADLKGELCRFKEATGKSVERLEREKADRENLEMTNQAQAEVNSSLQQQLAKARAEASGSAETARLGAQATEQAQSRVAELEAALAAAEARVRECELIRKRLHNTILELKGNIRVFCRVRPVAEDKPDVEVADGQPIVQFPGTGDLLGRSIELQVPSGGSGQPGKHAFAFDKVFGPGTGQEEVFEEVSQLVQSALDGYKVCIFAYGQTGSGKTHTMMGPQFNHEQRGVIPRAVEMLYQETRALEADGWAFDMKASMLEIYNEDYKDLLGKGSAAAGGSRSQQQVRHDDRGITTVAGVEAFDVRVQERLQALMARAAQKRSTGATAANEHSSRSHMVFMLTIIGTRASTGQSVHGVLNLIDLAGSERLSKSMATGDRLKETQAINKSLSALGDVISALGAKAEHIPFRNSRLTYLLQPCLGGDAKTLMFVNLAPTAEAAAESLCSLRFAAKVNATDIGTARRLAAPVPK